MSENVVDRICQTYAFTDADKATLTGLLAKNYLAAKVAAYRKAANAASSVVTLKHPWQPSDKDQAKALQWATTQVESIADTYLSTIRSLASTLTAESTVQDGQPLEEGLLGGLINAAAVAKGVAGGIKAFVEWKAPQIANVTTSSGANDGTSQWIEDALAEAGDEDESSDLNGVRVRVVPSNSSSDECADYAGNTYSLEDSVDLPDFPVHPNCIHGTEVYTV
jgi:hypothetical protein